MPVERMYDKETGYDVYEIRDGAGRLIQIVHEPSVVRSVNGMTGHVVLDADDVGAMRRDNMAIPPELLELQLASTALSMGAPMEDAVAIATTLRERYAVVGAPVQFVVEDVLGEVADLVERYAVERATTEEHGMLVPDHDDDDDEELLR